MCVLSAVLTVPSLAIARLPCLGFDLISKASKGLLFPGWRDKIITCGRSGKPHRRSTGRRSRQIRWIGVVSVRKFALALRPSHRDRSRNLWQVGFRATTARHDIPVYGRPTLSSRRLFGNGSYSTPDWPRSNHSSTQTMRRQEAGTAPIGLQKDGARRFRNED